MRTIDVVTTSRADFSIYRPILDQIETRGGLCCRLIVSGAHLDERRGMTVNEIVADGRDIAARIPVASDSGSAEGTAAAFADGVRGFAGHFAMAGPDILLVLGDRYEMYSAVVAAVPFKIPVAHIHGGEVTIGAYDDSIRHAMTKMSHMHFTSTETYAARVRQVGEEDWRVVVCGAPALDGLQSFTPVSFDELQEDIGLTCQHRPLLITYHPTTLDNLLPTEEISRLLSVLREVELPLVFTAPNADLGGNEIYDAIEAFVADRHNAVLVRSFGGRMYFSMMAHAAAMIGNSSSGIIEAASFELPVLDVGLRQAGRLKPRNVVTVANTCEDIRKGLKHVLTPIFAQSLNGMENPYFRGGAARIVADRLASVDLDDRLIAKRFCDRPVDGVVS